MLLVAIFTAVIIFSQAMCFDAMVDEKLNNPSKRFWGAMGWTLAIAMFLVNAAWYGY